MQASLIIVAVGCNKSPVEIQAVKPVLVMTVGAANATTLRTLPGIVTPRYAVNVGFQVAGRLQKRMVDVGSRVRQGQPLATLASEDYTQGVLAMQDQVAAARADLDQSAADAKRYKTLAERGMISQTGLGTQQARADAAQAKFDLANRQLELARNRLTYTTMRAPFDGIVTAINAEVGQVVSEGMSIVSLAKDDTLELTVELPEDLPLNQSMHDLKLDGRLTGKSATPLKLKLREVEPASSLPLRTYRAKFTILNAQSITSELRIGLSAEVTVPQSMSNAGSIQLPSAALISNGKDVAVWSVTGDPSTLRRQTVTVKGATNDGVLVDGLEAGQRIVIAGTDKLTESQPVRPIERTGTGTGYEPKQP